MPISKDETFENEKNCVLGKDMTILIFLIFESLRSTIADADSIFPC